MNLFFTVLHICFICSAVSFSSNSHAYDESKWDKFNPPVDNDYDWMQLTSGEWLKGEFVSLYDFSVEFDSDELDILKIDWEDVRQIRSAVPLSLQVEDYGEAKEVFTVVGMLHMQNNKAMVTVDGQVQSLDRFRIISIAKGSGKESDLWAGRVAMGVNMKGGNSDIVDSNFIVNAQRRTSLSRFIIDYVANFSRTDNVSTSNNHRVNSHYDSFLSSKLFWRVYAAEYHRDTFKNIDTELSIASSFGYDLIRTTKTEWDVTGGLGVLYKRFVSVEVGKEIDDVSPFIVFGTKYDAEVTKWMDYLADFQLRITDEDSGRYNYHLTTTLSSDLSRDLDLDISLVWDRVEEPQPIFDGSVPEKNDFQLIMGVSYDI